jgi:pyruvate,water dikinase
VQLARWARLLEEHFGSPQDVEWAVTRERRLVLVQSRPLRLVRQEACAAEPLPGYPVLLVGGEVACPGAGYGPAIHLDDSGDLDSFTEGGVLVSRRPSPKFVRLMDRVRAIVTDFGSTTGHMASLARELRIPALLNTKTATRAIPPGALITVDAASGFVYEGEVPSLLKEAEAKPEEETFQYRRRSSPEQQILEEVIKLLVPLTLTDPRSPDFTPEGCRTLHDLARYIHERSYAEMFGLGEQLGDFRGASYKLDVFLPVDLYLVDLGGGLKEAPASRKVKRAQIASVPFSALLKGMLHKKIPRSGPRPIDMKGLFSIMMRHAATNPEADATFHDPCYALISDCYLNYTARVGYHFSVVDTYCSGSANKNYISILFRGGAADAVRRNRRVRAIAGILKEHGFSVILGDDMVSARLSKASREETVAHLEMVGSLLQFFRQMDAAMKSEAAVAWIKDAFLRGDYDLSGSSGQETAREEEKKP